MINHWLLMVIGWLIVIPVLKYIEWLSLYISGWLLMCVNSSKWLFMIHDYHLLMTSNWRTNSILAIVDSVDCWWFPQLKELFVRNYLCWLVLWYNVYIYTYIFWGVPKIGVPPFIQNQTTLALKPMVLGYPHFRKSPFSSMKFKWFQFQHVPPNMFQTGHGHPKTRRTWRTIRMHQPAEVIINYIMISSCWM